jgi:hypothetical protein
MTKEELERQLHRGPRRGTTTMIPAHLKQYLEYVRNTGGGATRAHFIEDWEPIGDRAWSELVAAGVVRQDENARIHLTEAGAAALS